MRKIFIGIVCGLGAIIDADASIISRSFLDEALTNYATSTALDLKADKTDLTTLSEIVGTPAELTYRDIFVSTYIGDLMGISLEKDVPIPTNDISEFIKLNYTDIEFPGLVGVVESLLYQRNPDDVWPVRLIDIFDDYGLIYDEFDSPSFYDIMMNGSRVCTKLYGLPKLTEEVDKIGTLPTEYATVGAALTAIKGIAEEAKQKAEAAIPDPKAEGATGKFVLTVDIVGDNATYRWEKIDRATGEGTTTE